MPPKDNKKSPKSPITDKSSTYGESIETFESPRSVTVELELKGECPAPGEWNFLALFDGQIVLEARWQNQLIIETMLPLNLNDIMCQLIIVDTPLIFLLRTIGAKGAKDLDPLMHVDNRAGGNVDLSPLVLGQESVIVQVPLLLIGIEEQTGCKVRVEARANKSTEYTQIPLMITMISAHCLPVAKDGTVYVGAIGLDGLLDPVSVHFGMSLSSEDAKKVVWATASTGGTLANTAYNVPKYDKYIPTDFEPQGTSQCISAYWNSMKRLLVDLSVLKKRLATPFLIEIAGVPRTGKTDVRGRFMGFIDANVLLQPEQYGVTICTKLKYFSEAELPENVDPLLELPPSSAKVVVRDTDIVMDEHGHTAYVTLRFDLSETLASKTKLLTLFDMLGFPITDEGPDVTADKLYIKPLPEDNSVDVRRIRDEGGALAIHKELSNLACRGSVPMNQGIKRTAANRLLTRVRTMLRQFPPGECLDLDWQDTVTAQHAACRRAVTASFRPQPPQLRMGARVAASRCRMAGDKRIADKHTARNLKASENHPRALLAKVICCLEERNDREAKMYLIQALNSQSRNRFLLWTYAGQEFNKGEERAIAAWAALRISVKGDFSDGTANAIGWAALHTLQHYLNNTYTAYIAAMRMRAYYELKKEWHKFLERWINSSGEEEVFWIPGSVDDYHPMLIAAAFFLCLRCYDFSERVLQCFEAGCGTRGSRFGLKTKPCADVYYLRSASWLLRRQVDKALEMIEEGIRKFGPHAKMTQLRTTCLAFAHGWDGECEAAFKVSERAGAEPCPRLLLQGALAGMKEDPNAALQRAARAHKLAPSAHSALIIGRIYDKMGEDNLALRWAAAAVKFEPLLSDGWGFLALLAMKDRNVNHARTMLRTARQVGPISPDIEKEVKELMKIVKVEALPESMAKNLCFCEYYEC